jgi:hypothetical protein
VEGVEHQPIAENERQCLGFVALRKINVELRCRLQNHRLNGWVYTIVSVKNT